VAAAFDDEWTNILFVGRIVPNKKIDQLVRIFHAYKTRINPRSRLLLVGAYSGLETYLASVNGLIASLGVTDVHFAGHVTDEELIAYYDVADLFLCASEHEGFCVPLMEAFYKQIPVVALAATAVPATMDGGGVLYEDRDPFRVAALIDAVLSDGTLYDRVIASQDAAVARLAARDFPGLLLRFVEQTLASPRATAPKVAFDFWDQLTAYERLEELRLFRPGIYRGLPERGRQ
jgi:glycosyltransferase involved in cell wall biosynthesis